MAVAIQTETPAKPQQSVPGPEPIKGFLNNVRFIIHFSQDTMGVLWSWWKTYGELFAVKVGDGVNVNITNPDDIHEVLVRQAGKFKKDAGYTDTKRGLARFLGNGLITSNGEFWKRQRKLAAPALHAKRIASYADIMTGYTNDMLKGWRDGETVQMSIAMKKVTMEIVAKALFNTEVGEEAKRVHHALEAIQDASSGLHLLPPWVPTPKELRARDASKVMDEIIYRIIAERRATGEDNGDLLSMLLLARDDEGGMMSEKNARDEAITLFLAGHETTATLMGWMFYELARNPDVTARLHHELDTVLAGRTPTLDDLKKLPYTEKVVKEALRMYPSAWVVSREAEDETEIGGYSFKKGTVFNVMIYFLHHDARWFPNPEQFDPERFSPENEASIPKYAYIPFADGPRVCIGNMFAQMEAALLLATIASRFELALKPGYKPEMLPRLTLNVKGGLPMTIHARKV